LPTEKVPTSRPASSIISGPTSRPASSIISMAKCRVQACVLTVEEPGVSVITTPITGSSTAHIMRGVRPHYGGFLGDNFIPKTPINSSVCY